ncbi:MAG: acriflavine resistance protein B [Alphaproteobacteria bacterium HGW-Alphaproteobacteria-6]|nr:MAG: acriflavine resistance protein B [Alphaproteobacteria bacterium HGW-Alphaproteobacteria-6]
MRRAPRDPLAAAGGILSYFTRHATAANIVLVMVILAGAVALPRMRAQYFPDVVVETASVTVAWDGAGAEDVDRAIIQVLEPGMLAIEGVESVASTAREGRALIEFEFEPGWDMGRANDDIEAAIAAAEALPDDADPPKVNRHAWRDRVTDVIITGPIGADQLGRLADEFVARLYEVGITRTNIQGLAAPEIVVEATSTALIRHDLTLAEIAATIAAETGADPAGEVAGGTTRLRTGVEKRTPEAIAGIVLRSGPEGSTLTIGDVARISQRGADRDQAFFVGGYPAVSVRVDRSDQGDAIAVQDQVASIAAMMAPTLPEGVKIDLIRTRAEDIRARLTLLLDNGMLGLGMVLVLLFLFLNARTALWVAAGIPVAMLAAVAIMYAAGLTLNMISLFALILTLGIVVDDAIVIGEHADFRARHLGEAPFVAAERAVQRMAAPVFSSTVTTVAAFLGLMAIGGRFGNLVADIPFTVSVVLIASLLESFVILPNHMAHALAAAGRERWYDAPSRVTNRALGWVRDRLVRPLTRAVIVARYPVLAAALTLLALSVGLFLRGEVQWRFFSSPERPSVTGNFAMLPGATRADTLAYLDALQRATDEVAARYGAEYGTDPLRYVLGQVGSNNGRSLAVADSKEADLLGAISIELIDPDLRPWSSFDFVADLQEAAPPHPLLEELSFRRWHQGPAADALEVLFTGAGPDTLKAAAEALKSALARFGEVSALEDSLPYDKDELILELTPQGRALGFTIEALGRDLRGRLSGIEAAQFPDGVRSATIRVKLPDDELTADFLDRMMLRAAPGVHVPLSDIVSVRARSGFSTIVRENGQRVVSVTGDIADDDPARAAAIFQTTRDEILPRIAADYGVAFTMAGLSEQEDRFLSEATTGLILALAAIYAVLAWVFASWTRPIVVMAIIPFGAVGAIYGHWVWNLPLSMFAVIGMIGMAGIIINDSIVLITTVDDYARSRGLREAIVDAVADRLRPVLLTTATTVLGLAPLLYERSQQALFLKPTVVALCYGLAFGMVLVLLVVPALLAIQHDAAAQVASMRRGLRRRGLRVYLGLVAAAMVAAFALTLGPALVEGSGLAAGLLRFTAAAAGLILLATAGGALVLGLRRDRARRHGAPVQPVQP